MEDNSAKTKKTKSVITIIVVVALIILLRKLIGVLIGLAIGCVISYFIYYFILSFFKINEKTKSKIALGITVFSFLAGCGALITGGSFGDKSDAKYVVQKYADALTDKEGKEICELMFNDTMMEKSSKIYYMLIETTLTSNNLALKELTNDGIFDEAEYKFKDMELTELSDDNIKEINSYYKNTFGYNMPIKKAYAVKAMLVFNDENIYEINFPVIKVDGEWKVSATTWNLLIGKDLDPVC